MGYKYNRTLIIENNEDLLEFVNDLSLVLLAQHKEQRELFLAHKVTLIRDMDDCRKVNLESYVGEAIEPQEEQMDLGGLRERLVYLYENLDSFSYKHIRKLLKEAIEECTK